MDLLYNVLKIFVSNLMSDFPLEMTTQYVFILFGFETYMGVNVCNDVWILCMSLCYQSLKSNNLNRIVSSMEEEVEN